MDLEGIKKENSMFNDIESSWRHQIQEMYKCLLDREPEIEGLNYWVNELKNGIDISMVFNKLMGSDEYLLKETQNQKQKVVKNQIIDFIKGKFTERQLIIVDVGAQNLSYEDHIYTPLIQHAFNTRVIGFEPLENGRKGLQESENSGSLSIFDTFIGDGNEYMFHINNQDATSSLLPFNETVTDQLVGLSEIFTIKKEKIRTETLDNVLVEVEYIDLLKLDIQGFELKALQNAKETLHKTSVIQCEVSFIEIYSGQALFAEVDLYLRSMGFQFIDFQHECRYPFHNKHALISKDQLGWGDAIYLKKEPLKNEAESMLIQSLISLICFNKISLAASLIDRYKLLTGDIAFEKPNNL